MHARQKNRRLYAHRCIENLHGVEFRKIYMTQNPQDKNLEAARRIAHVVLLSSLGEKVRPTHTALIVIDIQKDFCAKGGLVDRGGRDVSAVQAMAEEPAVTN